MRSVIETSVEAIRAQVGERPGHLRAVGRGRLGGGRGAGAPGHRAPAHLRVRRHRPDAPGRGRAGGRDVPAPPGHRADPRARRRPLLRAARRRHRPRGEAQDHRRAVHPGVRGARRGHRPTPTSWCRARSTPTSSSRAPPRPPRSRATTTWAACPRTWSSSWSSRCAACSRTRCARSAPSWACPTRSSGASRSPVRAWGCGSSARSRPRRWPSLQQADAIVREEIRSAGLEREIWQAFAVLPDIRSVGVMGDERTYGYPIIVRAVTSEDAMTADWARLPYELLERMSQPHHQRGGRASTGSPTTSRRSRRAPSSGSERPVAARESGSSAIAPDP